MPLLAFSQIGNNPTIFHYGIELPNISKDVTLEKVLVIDNNGLVKWSDDIGAKISSESGNTLEQKNDGLYVGQAFGLLDVTQQAYTDKAIYVIPFDNPSKGMTYQEGSIDFSFITDGSSSYQMGLYSFSTGFENKASGTAAFSAGSATEASGNASAAFGTYTKASGDNSAAFGEGTVASEIYAVAFGTGTKASGNASAAFGTNTESSGGNSVTFGTGTKASGSASAAFGTSTESSGNASVTFGIATKASGDNSAAFGIFNDDSPEAIFMVGDGLNNNNRTNAFEVRSQGSDQESTLVIKSPNGTQWEISVDNSGNIQATQL